jgi:magnesium chelatase subunit D
VADPWTDVHLAAVLLAVHPQGLGGVRLRGAAGEARDQWLQVLRRLYPAGAAWQRMPLHIDDERLLGGLDLGATLQQGRVVLQQGLLARADGGVLVLPMAERLAPSWAAKLAAVLDAGRVELQRSGRAAVVPARLALVALDEGQGSSAAAAFGSESETEVPPQALLERLGLWVNLDALPRQCPGNELRLGFDPDPVFSTSNSTHERVVLGAPAPSNPACASEVQQATATAICAARQRLAQVSCGDDIVQALCEAALALGVPGLRASLFAVAAARAHAAWSGHDVVTAEDAAVAARLVLAPRATQLPAEADDKPSPDSITEPAPQPPAQPQARTEPPPSSPPAEPAVEASEEPVPLQDHLVQVAQAAIPPGLLALLASAAGRLPPGAGGRAGALQASRLRGRPYGSCRGDPRSGARLHLMDTLRAAAPWQQLRRRERATAAEAVGAAVPHVQRPAVLVRREDFHISRFRQRRETTTLFVVDASGSAAMHRLAEAKGAVELLLADCYVRRDHVALLAFRGQQGAELLLPPTRSLVRAKRSLAAMAGGGGTPLAAALDHARELTQALVRKGGSPLAVFLTDGRANIARDGSPGRDKAHADALAAASLWRASGLGALWIDIAQQPQAQAQQLAQTMGARYLPLPLADAQQVSRVVSALR